MAEQQPTDIRSALNKLTEEEWDRLRLRVWRQFGATLGHIPGAPDPDDLLHEAVEDLLKGKRHCPLERISLRTCLFQIVRGKVSHLYEKSRKKEHQYVSEDVLDQDVPPQAGQIAENAMLAQITPAENAALEPCTAEDTTALLAFIQDDPSLTRIITYQLEHPQAKARELARELGMSSKDVYNANRRLKDRLKKYHHARLSNQS